MTNVQIVANRQNRTFFFRLIMRKIEGLFCLRLEEKHSMKHTER